MDNVRLYRHLLLVEIVWGQVVMLMIYRCLFHLYLSFEVDREQEQE